VSGSGSIEAAN